MHRNRESERENRKIVAKLSWVTTFFTAATTDDNITKQQQEARDPCTDTGVANTEEWCCCAMQDDNLTGGCLELDINQIPMFTLLDDDDDDDDELGSIKTVKMVNYTEC